MDISFSPLATGKKQEVHSWKEGNMEKQRTVVGRKGSVVCFGDWGITRQNLQAQQK